MISFELQQEQQTHVHPMNGYCRELYAVNDQNRVLLMDLVRFPNSKRKDYDYSKAKSIIASYLNNNGEVLCYNGQHAQPESMLEFMTSNSYVFGSKVGSELYLAESEENNTLISGTISVTGQYFCYRFICQERLKNWLLKAKRIDPKIQIHQYDEEVLMA